MPKKSKAKVKSQRRDSEIHALAGRLFNAADAYVQAVCEVVIYARDGASKRRREMLAQALAFRENVGALFALIDPKHYGGN